MLPVARIPDEAAAQRLARAMAAAGMGCEIDRGKDGSWIVWVHEHARLTEARLLEQALAADPGRAIVEPPPPVAVAPPQAARPPRPLAPARTTTPATWALLGACVATALVAGLDRQLGPLAAALVIAEPGTAPFAQIRAGEVWRLVTPILLHFDPLHLLFNGLMLWQLGRLVEARLGTVSLLLQVLLYAVAGNVVQYLWAGPTFGGMSGVVYGLFGCAWIRGRLDRASGMLLRSDVVLMMLAWFSICLLGLMPIANGAHAGGLLGGMAWGWLSSRRRRA